MQVVRMKEVLAFLGQSRILSKDLQGVKDSLSQLHRKVDEIMSNQQAVKDQLTALTADVADEKTQIGGIEQVLDNLAAQLKALQDAAANADVPQEIVDQITALQTAVGANKQQIIGDIKKNTPSSTPPVQQ